MTITQTFFILAILAMVHIMDFDLFYKEYAGCINQYKNSR